MVEFLGIPAFLTSADDTTVSKLERSSGCERQRIEGSTARLAMNVQAPR